VISHRRFHLNRCRHAIIISIPANAEKRSRSRWNPCSRSPGIGVHDALETAVTFDRNNQARKGCRAEADHSIVTPPWYRRLGIAALVSPTLVLPIDGKLTHG
jgi:hypothetical protein